jgi:peptidyl-prolyl cis-trans isomerase SurA
MDQPEMSASQMMRTTRLQQISLAAALLCALTAGAAHAQSKPAEAAKPGSGFLPPASSDAKVLDSIYVVVNDEVITRNEVKNRVDQVVQGMRAQGAQLPDMADLQRQVVEMMIGERAQVQLAKEYGVQVADLELDRTIARIAESKKMSVQEMRNQMEKEGLTFAQFREEIRKEIMLQRLQQHEVDAKIQVSDAEVDTYLAAEKAAAADKVEMDIAQILVGIPQNASPEQIAARKARADEVMRQLRTGADFAKTAATYSDSPDALKGGEVGWRDPDRLPPQFAGELRKLKPGQVTPVIKSNIGFNILKLVNLRKLADNPDTKPAEETQTHVRLILMKPTPTMTETEVKRKLAELKEKIDNKAATFEDLARQYSQDSSASKGGDLGWLAPGDNLPEIEAVMNQLKPGEISGVVQSPFGFHLIQVVERKTEDVSKEKERSVARQVIHDRKLQEATEDWAREVRDRAYVEFRDDSNK